MRFTTSVNDVMCRPKGLLEKAQLRNKRALDPTNNHKGAEGSLYSTRMLFLGHTDLTSVSRLLTPLWTRFIPASCFLFTPTSLNMTLKPLQLMRLPEMFSVEERGARCPFMPPSCHTRMRKTRRPPTCAHHTEWRECRL